VCQKVGICSRLILTVFGRRMNISSTTNSGRETFGLQAPPSQRLALRGPSERTKEAQQACCCRYYLNRPTSKKSPWQELRWPRFPTLATLLAASLLMGGCAVGEPIVPADIVEMVNEQGRERTYDLVWQDIRRFEGALERGEKSDFADQALVIASRINRLAEGKASSMNRKRFSDAMERATLESSAFSKPVQHELLVETVVALRIAFDTGDFVKAQNRALRALAQAQTLLSWGGAG